MVETKLKESAGSGFQIAFATNLSISRVALRRQLESDPSHDTVSERLRRWTQNPMGSARRGSNPLGVVLPLLLLVHLLPVWVLHGCWRAGDHSLLLLHDRGHSDPHEPAQECQTQASSSQASLLICSHLVS